MAADTVNVAAGDTAVTTPARPSIPTTIPRTVQRTTRGGTPAALERPAYARLQALPTLSEDFIEQFGILEQEAWSLGIQLGVVRIGGCSGVLVSENGLVATSASCLDAAVGDSARELDSSVAFLAAPSAERALEGLEVERMTGLGDSLRTESIGDVRLVFRPEDAVARFGGEYDAESFPQYRFDVAFVRMYRDGQPLDTPERLVWAERNPRSGAPVFAAGAFGLADTTQAFAAVSGGRIRGFSYAATEAPPMGTFYGLFDRHHSHGEPPWTLPDNWMGAQDELTMHAALSIASNNEIDAAMLGGGLLALNRTYLGTLYDTNREAAADEIGRVRVVAVPATATSHVLEAVYGARALVEELETGRIPD